MNPNDFSAFGTLLSEEPEVKPDFSAGAIALDDSRPSVSPDTLGPMDEIYGFGRALKRGGNRLIQGTSALVLPALQSARDRLRKEQEELDKFDMQFSDLADVPSDQPGHVGDLKRDRNARLERLAKWQQDVEGLTSALGPQMGVISNAQQDINRLPPTPALEEFQNGDWLQALIKDPAEVSTSLMAESLPLSIPGMVAGTAMAGPVGTALGAGAGSFLAEYSTSILDSLQKAGIDIAKPGWENSVTDEQLRAATTYALQRGVPVSILDAISGGLAGKIAGPLLGKGLGKALAGVAGESALQAGTGMAGETLAQLNTGQPLDIRDIVAEGIAELPSGIYEAGKNIIESRQSQAPSQNQKAEGKPDFSQFGKAVSDAGESGAELGGVRTEEGVNRASTTTRESEASFNQASDIAGEERTATVQDVRNLLEEYLSRSPTPEAPTAPTEPLNKDVPQTEEPQPLEVNQALATDLQNAINQNQFAPRNEPTISKGELPGIPESAGYTPQQRNQSAADEQGSSQVIPVIRPEPIQRAPEQRPQPTSPPEVNTRPEGPTDYERLTGKPSDFSRQSETPTEPSRREDIAPAVERVAAKLPGAVPFEIVQSTNQLPNEVQRSDAQAVFHEGKVWLVADNLPNSQEAIRKYFHEQVGHHGVRIVLGEEFEPIMRSVFSRYSGTEVMSAVAKAYGLDLTQQEDRNLAAEEIVARIAENPELNPTLWRRIVTAIKRMWRKLTGADISEDEIKDLVRRAYRQIETQDQGIPYDNNREPRFSIPEKPSGNREPGPGEDKRRFMKQIQASSDLDPTIKEKLDNYIYTVRSAKNDAAFASEMVNDLGVDKAIELFRNREADIPGAIRTRLGNSIIKELGRQERQARMDLDFNKSEELVRKATEFIDFDSLNRSTDLGQAVQAFNDFSYLSPGGWLAKAKRVVSDAQGKAPRKLNPFIRKAKKELDAANKGAAASVADDTLSNEAAQEIVADSITPEGEDKKQSRRSAKQQLGIWAKYKLLIANSMKPVADSLLGIKKQTPALQGFATRVASVLRANLEAGKEKTAPPLTDIQIIAEALTNPEKYQEAWLKVGEVLKEKYKDNPAALELLDARLSLDPELVQNSRLDRAVAKKLKELNVKISDVIRAHYSEANATTRLLSDRLINEAGLSGEQALQLAKLVQDRMGEVTKEKKSKALEQAIKAKDGADPKKKKTLASKLLELSNLGAFTVETGNAEAAKLLGLPALTDEQKAKIYQMADDLQLLPDESVQRTKATMELMNYIAKASGRRFYDLPVAFWYANVLSGPLTHAYNAISNALNLGGNMASTLARSPTAVPSATKALVSGLRKGMYEAAETMRSGKQNPDIKFENINQLELLDNKDLRGAGVILKNWKYVSRLMIAADQLFFAALKEAKATILARGIAKEEGLRGDALDVRVRQILGEDTQQQAEAQATAEGLSGIEFKRRVNELIEQERDPEVQKLSENFARLSTYNNSPYGLLGAIARALNTVNRETQVSRFVVPFVNIAANVTNESLNYSPIGALRAAIAHRTLSKTGEATLHGNEIESMDPVLDAYSKAALGTLMLGALVAMHAKYKDDEDPWFALNGAGPKDWRKRRALTETGWKQYSIKVGNTYISFKDTPFAIPLGVAANYLDAIKYGKLGEEDMHNRLAYALMQIPHVVVQQSFLDSLANLLGAVDRSSEKKVGDRALEQIARSSTSFVVPNLLKQTDRIFDPTVYTSDDIKSMLMQQIPFVRRYGKPALNALGEPVISSPLKRVGSVTTEDTLWRDLGRKYALPSPPGQGLLTDPEFYDLIKERGPILRQALESKLSTINLSTPDKARKIVKAAAAKATKDAKHRLGFDSLEKDRRKGTTLEVQEVDVEE